MAFNRTKISLISSYIALMQGLFADAMEDKEHEATDGVNYLSKLLNTESIPENPAYLLFTAPYRICAGGCTGADKRPNLEFQFPMFLGEHGKTVYKQFYPNANEQKVNELFHKTRPTRVPFTTCPTGVHYTINTGSESVTVNRYTSSTGYPGYNFNDVKTKSTNYPDHPLHDETSTSRHDPWNSSEITRTTHDHDYTETTKRHTIQVTQSTRIPYFKEYLNSRRIRPLGFQPFRETQDKAFPDHAEIRNIRDLDVLPNIPLRISTIQGIFNPLEESESDYLLQSQQKYSYRNSITSNSMQSKKMQWVISMMRKTRNMVTSSPPLTRRLAPLRREPTNYQDPITADVEASTRNEEWPFGFMPVLPIQ